MLLGPKMTDQELPFGELLIANRTLNRIIAIVFLLVHCAGLFAFEGHTTNLALVIGWKVDFTQVDPNGSGNQPAEVAFSQFGAFINHGIVFLPVVFGFIVGIIEVYLLMVTVN